MFEEADLQMTTNGLHANGMPRLNGERQSSTDRSVSSPSQNGDDQDQPQDLEYEGVLSADSHGREDAQSSEGGPPPNIQRDVSDLKNGFIYVSHQLARIMKALHVPPCMCETCMVRHQQLNGIKAEPATPTAMMHPNAMQMNQMMQLQLTPQMAAELQQKQKMPLTPHMGQGYGGFPGGGKIVQADRKMVAEYARIHGAVAAAKKFGIPPPVSTYYQRKDSSNSLLANQLNQPSLSGATASPGPSSEGENDNAAQTPNSDVAPKLEFQQQHSIQQQQQQQQQMQQQTPTTPGSVPQSPMLPSQMVDMFKLNAAHSTGSPGFLRGRGRGRPKLIGDELDADLVEYMVSVKQADPHGHLTASNALNIAKQYILEKAPGLLEEHGGHVKLKLTWAMKLVTRITERQKEIELGLPAGTLSNMGRHQLNSLPGPGGNYMADMMAQSIISHHNLINMNNILNNSKQSADEEQKQEEENQPTVGATPEITNVKELNLGFLFSNGCGSDEGMIKDKDEGLIKEDGSMAGEIEPMTCEN